MNVIIIGSGKMVYFLAKGLASEGWSPTIISNDPEECLSFSRQLNATILQGDGSDPDILEQAEAFKAEVILALTPNDHDNLVACQLAKTLYDVPRTIALVNNPENEQVFRKLGVPLIFSATRILTSLLQEQTNFMAITNLMAVAMGRVNISEVILPENAPVNGKALAEVSLPEGFLITAIIRGNEILVPRGSAVLQGHDQLILIGKADNYAGVLKTLTGE